MLILEDGTSADRVSELTGELREYVADHDNVTGRIETDGITLTVVADEGRTGEILALWRSLAADDRVVNGKIETVYKDEDKWAIEVTAMDATGAMAVFKGMVGAGGPYRPLSWAMTSFEVSTGLRVGPGKYSDKTSKAPLFTVGTDEDGGVPAEAIAAYEAVVALYPVVGATLTPDHASIRVAENADSDRPGELARSAAPNLGAAVKVTSDSGN